jgi:hypothetical protein
MFDRIFNRLFRGSKTKWTWRWYVFRCRWFGIKFHRIRPEEDEWHTHPWNGISIIFGSYEEQITRDGPWLHRWGINFIGANREHRTRGNCFTLFIHGRRVNDGWYWGDKIKPWKGPQSADEN